MIFLGIREEANRIHEQGYNCAQSVLGACGVYTRLDQQTALAISSGFGGGVRSGEICGAISGAVMALGMAEKDKKKVAALARECVEQFRRDYGCVRCVELKRAGISCAELIEKAAQFVEDHMKEYKEQEI